MHFNFAQVFYVDPATVNRAAEVGITKINLYFKAKPKIIGNKSGIYAPGVEIFLAPTFQGIPMVDYTGIIAAGQRQVIQVARKEYNEIAVSSTSSTPTEFVFPKPVNVAVGGEYAIIIKFDGNEDFKLWWSKQGMPLIGNLNPSPGPSGKFIGKFFTYISPVGFGDTFTSTANTSDSTSVPSTSTQLTVSQEQQDVAYLLSNWKGSNDTDIKFQVFVARYSYHGIPMAGNTEILDDPFVNLKLAANNLIILSNNVIRLIAPAIPMEYVFFDKKTSQTENMHYGDHIYQYQPYYPGGKSTPCTISVANGSIMVNTDLTYVLSDNTTFTFSKLYDFGDSPECLVVTSLNHYGANQHAINVRRVLRQVGNSVSVTEPFTFSNTAAYFFKSPIGRLYSKTRPYITGHTRDLMVLVDSNANTSCRFVNDCIMTANIVSGGSGYANTDYLTISGFESVSNEIQGGYQAKANVVTYANGTLHFLFFSNVGAGFVNTDNITYTISNSSAEPSVGSDANLSFTVDTMLISSLTNSNSYFKGCKIVNFDSQQVIPNIMLNNPLGTTYSLKYMSLYHSIVSSNTYSGRTYFVDPVADAAIEINVNNNEQHNFSASKHPSIVSRSNQFVIGYANGFIPNSAVLGNYYSNTATLLIDLFSNNDFVSISFNPTDLNTFYAKYNINNDYTNEHTNYGNAFAKHVVSKVNFANGHFAEDLLVFLTAYRPANTDFKVYARIHNSHDNEAFDDKDWTLMEEIDGNGVYTSLSNPSDRVELTYGFRAFPNTAQVLLGVITTQLDNNVITGIGTSFSNNLAANDLVKVYQPLFANDDYIVAVVDSVTNNTMLTLKSPVANTSIVGNGLKIDLLAFPEQAFKNITSDNVVRYYNSSKVEFDTFDTFSIKVILLSPDDYVVPKIDDIRSVGATA
jgi:hypothetical protein